MSSVRVPPPRPSPAPLLLAERVAIGNRCMSNLRMQFKAEDQAWKDKLASRPIARCTAFDNAIKNISKGYQAMLAECARNNARQPAAPVELAEVSEETPPPLFMSERQGHQSERQR